MQARAYRPALGRFLTQDRFEDPMADQAIRSSLGGANAYTFLSANPTNNIEADGHDAHAADKHMRERGYSDETISARVAQADLGRSQTPEAQQVRGHVQQIEQRVAVVQAQVSKQAPGVRVLDVVHTERTLTPQAITADGRSIPLAGDTPTAIPNNDLGNILCALFCPDFSSALGIATSVPLPPFKGGRIVKAGFDALDDTGAAASSTSRLAPDRSTKYRGGRYGDLDAPEGIERHHTPADSVSPHSRTEGPAIQMEKRDHQQTGSWGRRKDAEAYRERQRELIQQDRMDDAIQTDIDDITGKWPGKYDDALLEMIDNLP